MHDADTLRDVQRRERYARVLVEMRQGTAPPAQGQQQAAQQDYRNAADQEEHRARCCHTAVQAATVIAWGL